MKELLDPKWLAILASVVDKTPECTEHQPSKKDLLQSETNTSHLHVLQEVMGCFPQEIWACGKVCEND